MDFDMAGPLLIGLILLVGELAVRLGYSIRKATDLERRVEQLERHSDAIFKALRELKDLITVGNGA